MHGVCIAMPFVDEVPKQDIFFWAFRMLCTFSPSFHESVGLRLRGCSGWCEGTQPPLLLGGIIVHEVRGTQSCLCRRMAPGERSEAGMEPWGVLKTFLCLTDGVTWGQLWAEPCSSQHSLPGHKLQQQQDLFQP